MKDANEPKVRRVCDFIAEHLSEDLTLVKLSAVADLSKFHFHRVFRLYTGVNVAKFVRLQRLKRASYQLVFHPELRILEIALEAHFESPEAFARAFKRAFGQSPSEFRRDPQWEPWHQSYQFITQGVERPMNVSTTSFERRTVAVLEHHGSTESLNHSIAKFIEWRKTSKLSPVKTSDTFGVVFNDPNSVAPEDFRFDICGVVSEPVPQNPQGVVTKEIPAGRCAVLRHVGSRDALGDKVCQLYSDWLPESGEELRDFPVFFHYLNLYPEVAENELVTDIYVPLA